MFNPLLRAVALVAVAYLALVLELASSSALVRPVWAALAVTAIVMNSRSSLGVFGAAGVGLAVDAASHSRLGLHVAVYGVTAALCVAVRDRRATPPWWMSPLLAFLVATNDGLVSRVAPIVRHSDATLRGSAVETVAVQGALTALAAASVVFGAAIARRLWAPSVDRHNLQLSNRWTMLTE